MASVGESVRPERRGRIADQSGDGGTKEAKSKAFSPRFSLILLISFPTHLQCGSEREDAFTSFHSLEELGRPVGVKDSDRERQPPVQPQRASC